MSAVFVAVLLVTCVAIIWMIICNERTLNQRIKVIEVVFSEPQVSVKLDAFHLVSYEKHMYMLFFFRNPLPLYGEAINKQLSGLSA